MNMIQPSGYFGFDSKTEEFFTRDLEFITGTGSGLCDLWRGVCNERIVAFKALKKQYSTDTTRIETLRREYEIGKSLKHPGVCETMAWVELPHLGPCIMMEWIEGISLESLISRKELNPGSTRKILLELCDAISYLHHKQVVHKDLKPENILITRMGGNVKVIDFGLSDSDSNLTGKEPGGTRFYAAPEVLAGGMADFRSDIYSLGKIIKEVSDEYLPVAQRCLEPNPESRFSSVDDVKDAILHLRPKKSLVPWLIAALVAAAVIIGFFFKMKSSTDPASDLFRETAGMVKEAASRPS